MYKSLPNFASHYFVEAQGRTCYIHVLQKGVLIKKTPRGDQLSRIVGELYLIGDEIDGCFNEDWLVDWSFG